MNPRLPVTDPQPIVYVCEFVLTECQLDVEPLTCQHERPAVQKGEASWSCSLC